MEKKRRLKNRLIVFGVSIAMGLSFSVACYVGWSFSWYAERIYNELQEIARKTVTDGKGINLEKIPKENLRYSITTNENGETIFEYILYEEIWTRTLPKMTIILSKDNRIVSQNSDYKELAKQEKEEKEKYFYVVVFTPFILLFMWGWAVVGSIVDVNEKPKPKKS